ncbi:MAG: Fmu (Sun) domain-containing protein [Bacteroidetes bacterium]|nr:Fmu (Sun) domain-containing protein [Bacteroidota bacterium]
MIFDNQLRHAINILDLYKGDMPLHVWLKDFFRLNKQMGSRDRKLLSSLVYSYYRLGHSLKNLKVDERLLAGFFLCNDQPHELLNYFKPEYNEKAALPLEEKIAFFQSQPEGSNFKILDIFPWQDELSPGIDPTAFCLSFLRQPDLFLRIRPGHEQSVRNKLDPSTPFIPPFTLRLPNGFKVEDHFTPDLEVVIQDYSSQRIAEFLQTPATPDFFWDACAASGGKSILTHDLYPNINITASDIRNTILKNLRSRFSYAGITNYQTFLADLTRTPPPDAAANADLILADVPCTGSGTWSRTPEDLYFFNPQKITNYATAQRSIIGHIAPRLQPGAWLVYSTCSVFKKENEEMAALIKKTPGLKQNRMENIKGYDLRADTMFAARFTR